MCRGDSRKLTAMPNPIGTERAAQSYAMTHYRIAPLYAIEPNVYRTEPDAAARRRRILCEAAE